MATIKEIARYAGVSIGTVDRVLHQRGNVSPEAAARVHKAVLDLKYTPNILARQLKLSRSIAFGVIMPGTDQDSGYWSMPARGIDQAEKELEVHRIRIRYFHYDRYSPMSFSKCCEDALQSGLDGFLMAPALSTIAQEFVQRLPEKTPCIFFDSPLPDAGGLCSIVQDSHASGYLAGRLMHMLTGKNATIVAIRGLLGDYHIEQRVRGFSDYFTTHHLAAPVVFDAAPEGTEQCLREEVDSILQQVNDVKGLFVSHALTYCAAKVLESRPLDERIHVIGYDLIPENVACLKRGSIDFLISQQSRQQGYLGIYTLFRKIVLNEPIAPMVLMPLDILARENVDFYQIN